MIRSKTLTKINEIVSESKGCCCNLMADLVKVIGDSGDKSEWVEYRNGTIRIRTKEQLICLDCKSQVCSCCRSSA
jgi:hypothetical protein